MYGPKSNCLLLNKIVINAILATIVNLFNLHLPINNGYRSVA